MRANHQERHSVDPKQIKPDPTTTRPAPKYLPPPPTRNGPHVSSPFPPAQILSMPILAAANLFSSPPSTPRFNEPLSPNAPPPLPIPKRRAAIPRMPQPDPSRNAPPNPGLKSTHNRTRYYKPVPRGGVLATDGGRSVVVGESGVSYLLPGNPFEFQYSYSEMPKERPLAIREPAFLPFALPTMPQPWTGKAPLMSKKDKERKKIRLSEPLGHPPATEEGEAGRVIQMAGPPVQLGKYPMDGRSREEIHGEPLTRAEVRALIQPCLSHNRQANLVSRRNAIASLLSSSIFAQLASSYEVTLAEPSIGFREHIDLFDGYTFIYPKNWIQVRGAGADIFFRDPFVLDENLSVELSSPSSSRYTSVEDLGPPQVAAEKVLKQYLIEFMSTRLGVRRESNILSTSSRVADDGRVYYQVEVNIKSYASNNELAVMPQDRVPRLEWDRRYLSVLGVENNRLYELRLQIPESVFFDEEKDLKRVMDSFRVLKAVD